MVTTDFRLPRRCRLAPIAALHDAVDRLVEAADQLLAGDLTQARETQTLAGMWVVRDYASRVMGTIDPDIIRHWHVERLRVRMPMADRAERRGPTTPQAMEIYVRDGCRCRYCGCRVVLPGARRAMDRAVPDAVQWEPRDRDMHAAFCALTAVIDHLVPHSRGGTNDASVLVTSRQSCNYGKGDDLSRRSV